MGIPRILPMRKPNPRFMTGLTISVAQDANGSGAGRTAASSESGVDAGTFQNGKNTPTPPVFS